MVGGARAGGNLMTTLVCLGLGYCARHYVSAFGARFDCILGTTRNADHAAELHWQALGRKRNFPVAILRLGGIYGPGRNGMVRLLHGTAQRIAKPGHVSNRVHVYDIAQAIDAAFARGAEGVFNIVDDEPASPSDQIAFAARLIGIPPPPEIPYEDAGNLVSPMALSFYEGCIRARNNKLKAVLGVKLRYPTYRDGLCALYKAGDHLSAAEPATSA